MPVAGLGFKLSSSFYLLPWSNHCWDAPSQNLSAAQKLVTWGGTSGSSVQHSQLSSQPKDSMRRSHFVPNKSPDDVAHSHHTEENYPADLGQHIESWEIIKLFLATKFWCVLLCSSWWLKQITWLIAGDEYIVNFQMPFSNRKFLSVGMWENKWFSILLRK